MVGWLDRRKAIDLIHDIKDLKKNMLISIHADRHLEIFNNDS